jgi:hypothetical protein
MEIPATNVRPEKLVTDKGSSLFWVTVSEEKSLRMLTPSEVFAQFNLINWFRHFERFSPIYCQLISKPGLNLTFLSRRNNVQLDVNLRVKSFKPSMARHEAELGRLYISERFRLWMVFMGLYYKTFYSNNCCRIIISYNVCHLYSLPP